MWPWNSGDIIGTAARGAIGAGIGNIVIAGCTAAVAITAIVVAIVAFSQLGHLSSQAFAPGAARVLVGQPLDQ